jgi:transaldolase
MQVSEAQVADPFVRLREVGQSLWLDNLTRDMLHSGALARLVERGEITGVTTNPSIFRNAILSSDAYRADVARLRGEETDPERRYERLAVADVRAACDVLRPVYDNTRGDDGYVSLEVSPRLADDAEGTVAAARRLHAEVGRDNLLIKIPGTAAGARAFEECIAHGIGVNVTLLFSASQLDRVFDAYVAGLERWRAAGGALARVKAVASFFLSRIDTLVDRRLEALGTPEALALRGQTAVATAKLAYRRFGEVFGGERFAPLAAAGARPQYLLWASTSTKNPAYHDLLYVEPLMGPRTINTLPDATLAAFRDHGRADATLMQDVAQAEATFVAVERLGIAHEAVGSTLQQEGIRLFDEAYTALIDALA